MKKQIALSVIAAALVGAGGAYAAQKQAPVAADTAPSSVLTRAEAQTQAATAFARMDFNKDGKIDQTDRTARREAARAKAFDRLDTDKNGQISKAEFTAERSPEARANREVRPHREGRPDGESRGEWRGKGRHGDGAANFRGGSGRYDGRHEGRHSGGFRGMMGGKSADANNDGAITAAEFTNAALTRFDAMDSNKDGNVTQAERQAAREAMKQQRRATQATAPNG